MIFQIHFNQRYTLPLLHHSLRTYEMPNISLRISSDQPNEANVAQKTYVLILLPKQLLVSREIVLLSHTIVFIFNTPIYNFYQVYF